MFEKLFKKEEAKTAYENSGVGPGDYYGRFTLKQVDEEVDELQLDRWLSEVQLDLENNKVRLDEYDDPKYRKRMNFCRFFMTRIKQRLAEIKKIQHLSKTILGKIKKTHPDRWQLIVSAIVEHYPGVDINFIIQEVDKGV